MITCQIIFPTKKENFNQIKSVILPSESGEVEILPNHSKAFFVLKKDGFVLLKKEKETKKISINGGISFFENNNLIIVA